MASPRSGSSKSSLGSLGKDPVSSAALIIAILAFLIACRCWWLTSKKEDESEN